MVRNETGAEQPLFAGVIRSAGLITYGGYNRFHIELQSGTIQMDRVKRSRSFQDVDQTYSQVAQRVASGYEDGAVIPTVGLDKPLGVPGDPISGDRLGVFEAHGELVRRRGGA